MATGMSVNFLLNQMRCYSGSLAGGTVAFYNAGTTTLVDVYLDKDMTLVAANPYGLSADGTAELFGSSSLVYRVVIKNSAGVIVYDFDNVLLASLSSGGGGGGGGGTVNVVAVTTSDVPYTLTEDTDQYVVRTGDNEFLLTVSPAVGWTFHSGVAEMNLYNDGEVMHFLLVGSTVYVVA